MRFHAQLPLQFWGECALTAVHIINRLPSHVLSFKTPFEILDSKQPSFSHLRVFGCLAYATNVHTPHKFAPRSIPFVFFGYPTGQKAYKLFDLSNKIFFTSRDVRFHENTFPFANAKPNLFSQHYDLGPIPLITPDHNLSIPFPLPKPPSQTTQIHPPDTQSTHPPTSLRTYNRHPKPTDPSINQSLPIAHPNPPSTPLLLESDILEPPTPSTDINTIIPPTPTPPRRSSRHAGPPAKLSDYVCSNIYTAQSSSSLPGPPKGTRYPLAAYVSYHRYQPLHRSFIATISSITEPRSYSEAPAHPEWQAAM